MSRLFRTVSTIGIQERDIRVLHDPISPYSFYQLVKDVYPYNPSPAQDTEDLGLLDVLRDLDRITTELS